MTENPCNIYIYIYIDSHCLVQLRQNYDHSTFHCFESPAPWLRKHTHCNSWCNYHKYQNWIPIESETRPFQTIIAFVTFGIMNIKKTSTKAKIYYNFLSFLSNLNKWSNNNELIIFPSVSLSFIIELYNPTASFQFIFTFTHFFFVSILSNKY